MIASVNPEAELNSPDAAISSMLEHIGAVPMNVRGVNAGAGYAKQ